MLTLKQYSELYHVNLKNLRRKAAEGKISGAVKIDGRWMIPKKNNK
jgi:predicted site-specific integrase-resolvase